MHTLTDSRILVVEDDPRMCESIRYLLDSYGFSVNTSQSLVDALKTLLTIEYDLVLLDLQLGDQSGFAVMDHLLERELDTRVIVVTGSHSERNAITALKKGAIDYLKKPFEPETLVEAVKQVLERQKKQRELYLFKRIVTMSQEAIIIGDHDGRIIYANAAYRKLMNPQQPTSPPLTAASWDDSGGNPRYDSQIKVTIDTGIPWQGQVELIDARGKRFVAWKRVEPVPYAMGGRTYGVALIHGMTRQLEKAASQEKRHLQEELEKLKIALAKVKCLSGTLPICSSCKKIRDDQGYWCEIEAYIQTHSDAEFTHGICPDCARRLYPELYRE